MFVIFLVAFFSYEYLSVVDIMGFVVFMIVACLVMIPIIYRLVINLLRKRVPDAKRFFYFPAVLIVFANLPVYIIIVLKTNDLFGWNEAMLFFLGFLTTALVFGLSMAWKQQVLTNKISASFPKN